MYEAALLVVVRAEYKTAIGSWTSFNIVGPPFGGVGDAAAWCRWTDTIDPETWCPDGGDLTDGDGLAPTFGGEDQVPEGDCANASAPGALVNTSTLDWGGTPGDVTIA